MFQGFARVWTPVSLSAALPPGRPVRIELAGTPLVLFRGEGGRPAALLDRCPHRGVALSLGKVVGGEIECPFHGWKLDGAGHVCHVPWNPDAKLTTLSGVAIPTVERAGQIWVYTEPGAAPARLPEVHEVFLREDVRVAGCAVDWEAHWTRAMENMLDWPHLPFVHGNTIGKAMRRRRGVRMDIAWEPEPWGARSRIQIDGEDQPTRLDFRWPNRMNLFIPIPSRTLVLEATCVPISATRTRMLLVGARDFMKPRVFDWLFDRMNRKIAAEDRAIVESSFPVEIPPATDERSVRTDEPTLHFRKRYFAELHGSSAGGSVAEGRRTLPVVSDRAAIQGATS